MIRLMSGFFVTSGLVLAASAVGLLVGVERLLQTRTPKSLADVGNGSVSKPAVPPDPPAAAPRVPQVSAVEDDITIAQPLKADRHFSIKRTKSEVGYVYWILEGHGKYKCFVLCDSWDEAVAQAKARMAGDDSGGNEAESAAESLAERVLSLS